MKYRQCRERSILGVAIAGTVVAATLPILVLGEGFAIASEPSQQADSIPAESIAQDFQSGGNPSKRNLVVDAVPSLPDLPSAPIPRADAPALPALAPSGELTGAGNQASPNPASRNPASPRLEAIDSSTIFSDRLRLGLNTTFSGQDLLFTRLQAANTTSFEESTGTPQSRLSFDGTTGDGNDVVLDTLRYQFFFNPKLRVTVSATGTKFDDIFATLNPEFSDNVVGSLSRFGQYNPLYRLGDGAGLGLNYDFSKSLNLSLAYFADDAGNPADKAGLFNGQFAALGQLTYQPNDRLGIGLAYSRYYAPGGQTQVSGGTGSVLANQPFADAATAADVYALNATYRLSSRFNLSGWYGYTNAQGESSGFRGDRATIQNWAVTLGFLDLLARGNLAGIIFGQPPRVTDSDYRSDETGSTYHVEAFYRFRFSEHFALTPGFFVTNNPERDGNSIWVGTLRTSFSF